MSIIFKTFRTYKHPYLYDRHTNSLVVLSEEEFQELRNVEIGKLPWEESAIVKKYQDFGMLQENVVEKIEHPETTIVEHYQTTRLHQLTLQVTQQCNLRCEYCAFSGIYRGSRTHSKLRMDWKTAKKAIDFFLARTIEMPTIVIGFYGGEPLLEMELIKKCVEYSKNQIEGKELKFNMTTNGTLLTDEVVDYLVEQNFDLSISLDGSEEEHDANRKFANGKGSFTTIISNIRRIKERYPEYNKKINIMTTINPHSDLGCVLEFFSTDEVFSDRYIMFNPMKETALDVDMSYSQKYYKVRNYEYIKMLFSLVDKLSPKYVSKLMQGATTKFETLQDSLKSRETMVSIMHHNGPCPPGVQRLFVNIHGNLYPCERVNEEAEFFKIGTLDTGFDLDKVRAILNIGQCTENECKNCWGLRKCSLCSYELEVDDKVTREIKIKKCAKIHRSVLFDLHEISVLNEFGFKTEGAKYY